jgi:hypothetical protein
VQIRAAMIVTSNEVAPLCDDVAYTRHCIVDGRKPLEMRRRKPADVNKGDIAAGAAIQKE